MRRMLSLFVVFTLLAVSSVPLGSAVACEMPAQPDATVHNATMLRHGMAPEMQAMSGMMNSEHGVMPTAGMHAGHDHSAALAGDWQHCCIECGCGCHRSIDTLPHLLAPHSADSGFQSEIMASERTAPAMSIRLAARDLAVVSPPPDTV